MKNSINSARQFQKVSVLPVLLGMGLTIPVSAAHATIVQPDEVVVTARRMKEDAQTVPISLTVFNQDMLDERNVVNAADLATFTPSLTVKAQFGTDQASFAIRGFSQEFRTTASVAVYFADVVAPRGGGAITAGDGAGPGSFFDLQNVQVLKGPQGTLFGRNTTGGAIQLVPQEPTSKLEGYLEQSLGNYNMRKTQGVLNVPLGDIARARFGFETHKRDGYLKNQSGIGPTRLADLDYDTYRVSLIVDLTDSIQNYTIASYTNSENNGTMSGMFFCSPTSLLKDLCGPALAHQGSDFYNVESDRSDPYSKLKQWQVINKTTWNVSDDFVVKNNIAYANLETHSSSAIFGSNFKLPDNLAPVSPAIVGIPLSFYPSSEWPGIPTNSQTSFVEELQFSGTGLDDKLTWQGGLYYENSRPDGVAGQLSPSFISCGTAGLSRDPNSWKCFDILGPLSQGAFAGSVSSSIGKVEFINQAIYSQGTYSINDEFKFTLGARYTVDETKGQSQSMLFYNFPSGVAGTGNGLPPGGPGSVTCIFSAATPGSCKLNTRQKSEAPTWTIGLDYLPAPDVMIYTKYTRGYRQGSVNIFAPETLQTYEQEQVDSYEIGAKTGFRGAISGTFNISLFYNDLKDQQLQLTYLPPAGQLGSPAPSIVNAGASTIQGIEAETTLKLTDDLAFTLSYTYLDTHVDEIGDAPAVPGGIISYDYNRTQKTAYEGGHLPFSPRHSVTTGLSYHLPLSADMGDLSVGATYSYISEQVSAAKTPFGTLAKTNQVNLNMGWKAIAGSAFDAALFVTNATNEEIVTFVPGLYNPSSADQAGMEFRSIAPPRMYGARVKYNFSL